MSLTHEFDLAPLVFGEMISRQRTEDSIRSAVGTPIVRVHVKNTFIEAWSSDGDDSAEEEEALPVVATKSCPAMKMPSFPPLRGAARETACDTVPKTEVSQQAVPLEFRQPECSAGSAVHGLGQCKPCAWFWRPQGCDNGVDCRHCHLCPAGELKARKIFKRSTRRKPEVSIPENVIAQDFTFVVVSATPGCW